VQRVFSGSFLLLGSLLLGLSGCEGEEEITLAQRPKDPPPVVRTSTNAPSANVAPLHWTVPPGWRELPAQQMRFAAFAVNDSNPAVEMTVIPLGPESAALLPNVNRWEKQLGLPESPQNKLSEVVKHFSVNGLEADVVDLTGVETAKPRQRMLAAIVPAGGRVWFFKLSGPVDVVTAQKANFDAFIGSLHAGHESDDHASATPQAAAPSALASYQAPSTWREIPDSKPPRMLAFQVGEKDMGAEVVLTKFASNNTGSFDDNVTRWRGQIGLPPVEDARSTPMKDLAVGKTGRGMVLEFHNPQNSKRMLVLIAEAGSDLWFVKMAGPADVVDAERTNFEAFAKSMEFGDGSLKQ
jgi:hypothetical protein